MSYVQKKQPAPHNKKSFDVYDPVSDLINRLE
jgi:hypothetical protein